MRKSLSVFSLLLILVLLSGHNSFANTEDTSDFIITTPELTSSPVTDNEPNNTPGQATSVQKEFTLDKLLSLALKQNPTLQARRNQTLAEEDAYKTLRKLPNPSIALEKGRGESFDGDISRDIQGLTLSQVIKNPVSWHFRVEAAEKGWQAASELYRLTELELICQIKQKCYSIWLLRNKRNLSEKKTASIKQMSQLIRKRAELGEVKPLDALKLQVEFLLARNELKEMETELQIARDQLNEFLGGLLPSEFTIKGDLKFFPSLLEENQMVNKALLAHPLIKEKESRVAQIENHLAAEKWSRLPDLELSAFSRKELHGKISGFGLSLDLPLWNLKSKEISRAENLLQVEKKELEALRLNLISRVETELRRLNLSEETILVFQEGLLKQAEASLDIAEISYQEGEISLLEFLDAQRTFYTILNDYQDALFRWNANRAALEKTIGEKLE